MNCPQCHKEAPTDDRFCVHCGALLPQAPAPQTFHVSVLGQGDYRTIGEAVRNAREGIVIEESGLATVRRCAIRRNAGHGVQIADSGQGTFEDCDLRDNASGVWDIAEGCDETAIVSEKQGGSFPFAREAAPATVPAPSQSGASWG